MKGYWIVKANTVDSEKQKKYASYASETVKKYGGCYIVRGGENITKEGKEYERNVVVEFPSYEIAKQAYESVGYKRAKEILGSSKDRMFAIVEGAE